MFRRIFFLFYVLPHSRRLKSLQIFCFDILNLKLFDFQQQKGRKIYTLTRTWNSDSHSSYKYSGNLKQPRRVCGRLQEKMSEVWVENVVQSGKNKCSSKLPSRLVAEVGRLHWMPSFKEIRELLLFSVENNTINEEEFFLLSEGFKYKICYCCSQPFYSSFAALLEAILQRCNSAACLVGKNSK